MMRADIHTHILFGMDDGAQSLNESLELLELQIAQGINTVVLTSHFNCLSQNLDEFIEKRDMNIKILRSEVKRRGLDIKLLSGSEVLFSSELLDMNLDALTIEKTDYLLIEFSTQFKPHALIRRMDDILFKGYIPIIAHIERYPFLINDTQLLVNLIDLGVLTQVNASTFLDKRHSNFINACMKHNLVHLIASDTHSIDVRPPNVKQAFEVIEARYGIATANLLVGNAKAVVYNDVVETDQPTNPRKIFGRFI